jgi:sugar (pentulose or hexulose) kinase
MQFNSLFQLAAMKKQNSAQLPLAKSLLFTPDLFHFWLTGNKANEYSIASTSQMLDAKARAWDVELLNRLGLPHQILQNIVAPGTKIGNVRESLATHLGLSANVPVIAPGSHDTASAVAAVPSQGENWAYLSSGTWSLMGIELREPLLGTEVLQRAFTNEGGVGNTIRFLKNIAGLWLVQECRRTWLRQGTEYSYAELTQMAEAAPAFKSIIEPDNARFAAPADMPQEIADYCRETGQAVPQSPGEFVRCCLESLALKYRRVLENLEELRGAPLDVLHIVGGGTQNKLLSRFTADCIARPVITGPVEGTGIGNILTQAMGLGELKNLDEIRAVVRASFPPETLDPNAAERVKWDAAYDKFLTLS